MTARRGRVSRARARATVGALALFGALAGALAGARPASGATSNAFLPPSGGPRVSALGGHLVSLLGDDHALDTNPARLVYTSRVASAQFDRLDPDLDLWRGRVGIAFGAGPDLTDAFQPARMRASAFGIALDVLSLSLIEGSTYREAMGTAGIALALTNFAAVGLAGRYARAQSDVVGINGNGFGVDVGLSLKLSDHWDAGLAIRDAFGRTKYETSDDEDRPARLSMGLAASGRRRWQAEADYVFQNNRIAALSGGLEVHVVPGVLDLRGGVSREALLPARTVATAGAGFSFRRFQLDYAYGNDADGVFEKQHRVALSARF